MFSLSEQVDTSNPLHLHMLANLQANILKHHGRRFAWHCFIQFDKSKSDDIKKWINQFACTITDAAKQLEDAAIHKLNSDYDGGTVCCFFLTKKGYEKLGSQNIPSDEAFVAGLKNRQAEKLFDAPYSAWEDKFKEVDAMILLADMQQEKLQQSYEDLKTQTGNLFSKLEVQKGEILTNEHGLGIEHFGYADGVSQPSFIKDEVAPGKTWDDNSLPEILLVNENVTGHTDCFGSYFVFLKLEQNVERFKAAEDELGDLLEKEVHEDKKEDFDDEVAGAYLVGRFETSNPVVKYNKEKEVKSDKEFDNDFDYRYDKAGSKCPFHAHVRLTNPRNGGVSHTAARIARRGIPYDEAGRNNDLDFKPSQDVGLLFMCYQVSITKQFEIIQKAANTGLGKFAIDAVIGQGENPREQTWPKQWGMPGELKHEISKFITMKGGEYFYAPSIPFLKNL